MTTSMFNVRLDDPLMDAVEAAAESSGLKKSVWAREVFGAVALGGVTLEELADLVAKHGGTHGQTPHPARYLALQHLQGRRGTTVKGCLHPEHLKKRLPFTVVCGVCGEVLKKT